GAFDHSQHHKHTDFYGGSRLKVSPNFTVGRAFCWGRNTDGQLGNGVVGGAFAQPQQVVVPGGSQPYFPFHTVLAGAGHTCAQVEAVDSPGFAPWTTYCWGNNSLGQLGQGPGGPPRSALMLPVRLPVVPGYFWDTRGLAVGDNHSCLMPGSGEVGWSYNGKAYCWGSNSHGQLGNGTGGSGQFSASLVQVSPIFQFGLTNPENMPPPYTGLLAAGMAHTCAVTISHAAACWGSEYWGTVGNGVKGTSIGQYPTLFANKPVAVDTSGVLSGVFVGQVAAGGNRSLALPDFPGAPRNVSARGADGSAWVAFAPPWSWQTTAPITNYEYKLTGPNGDGVWHPFDPPTTTSPALIPGLVNGGSYDVQLRAVTEVGGREAVAGRVRPYAPTASVFFPITPARAYDSRTAGPGGTATPLAVGETRVIDMTGASIPEDASAIAYNLTVVNPAAAGHLRVVQAGGTSVQTSTVNFVAGQTIANASVVKGGHRTGYLTVFNGASVQVNFVVDAVGFYLPELWRGPDSGNLYTSISPARAYDSRGDPAGPLAGGADRLVSVAGQVPAGATAVAYNLTVANTARGGGHLRVMPGDVASTPVSSVNWSMVGDTVANASVIGLDAQRRVRVHNGSGLPVQFIVDVVGYYLPKTTGEGAMFYPIDPARAYDSRSPFTSPAAPLLAGQTRAIAVRDAHTTAGALVARDVVPPGATAIAYNLTEAAGTTRSHFRAFPTGAALPDASSLNWPAAGFNRANGSQVTISGDRQVSVFNSVGSAHVIVDTLGYFK
ncbi:MAG: hypothetical protein QG597_1312, partial [Actinomycetota bacterium]|nr:hypothetical protein [Actinomycetota bacterium]